MFLWKFFSPGKDRGEDVNNRNADNQTVLMDVAGQCSENHLSILKLLLEQPSTEVNLADDKGNTALHVATNSKNIEAVKILLADQRVDVNSKNSMKMTPLIIAAKEADNIDILKLLIAEPRVDVNCETANHMTALLTTALHPNIDAARLLLDDPRVDVNQMNGLGYTALHVAAHLKRKVKLLELFLAHPRVDVNCHLGQRHETALHVAVANNNVEGVKLILAEPRLTSLEGQEGFEAVRIAVSEGNGDILKELVYHQNIDLAVMDENGLGLDDLIR